MCLFVFACEFKIEYTIHGMFLIDSDPCSVATSDSAAVSDGLNTTFEMYRCEKSDFTSETRAAWGGLFAAYTAGVETQGCGTLHFHALQRGALARLSTPYSAASWLASFLASQPRPGAVLRRPTKAASDSLNVIV